jgi:hypothetical protein
LSPQEKVYETDGEGMNEINFIKKEPITKGWSEDKKYCEAPYESYDEYLWLVEQMRKELQHA